MKSAVKSIFAFARLPGDLQIRKQAGRWIATIFGEAVGFGDTIGGACADAVEKLEQTNKGKDAENGTKAK